jgi:hypothetical protein
VSEHPDQPDPAPAPSPNFASPSDEIDARYQQAIARYAEERVELAGRDGRLSVTRGIVFFVLVVLGVAAYSSPILWWFVGFGGFGFLVLAGMHEQMARRLQEVTHLQTLHQRQLARRNRQWDRLPRVEIPIPPEKEALARDLDLFGPRSLYQWLCLAQTPVGRTTLRDWLLWPADRETIEERQRIVASLAREFEWREELQLHGMLLRAGENSAKSRPGERPGVDEFLEWAEGPRWLSAMAWLRGVAWLVPVSFLAILLLFVTGTLTPAAVVPWLLLLVLLSLAINVVFTGRIHATFDRISGSEDRVRHYQGMLSVVTRLPERVGQVPIGEEGLREVSHEGLKQLAQLHRILRWANARRDALFGILHMVAQLFLIWEVHLLARLEAWQVRWGRDSRRWFAAIGQLEALASLAAVAHDHPDWNFPQVDPALARLEAEGLGHPLLPETSRVTNDIQVGPSGTFVLVTGSNMSGKSTLLRSVGINSVLAQAGSVVCARQFRLPPLEIETSIRVGDSLADGVSLYLAELRRMKDVVDRAKQLRQGERKLLFLLDEILHGTNSRERQVAVERVVRHLVSQGAIGMVTTHDLELAAMPALQGHCQPVHLRETLYWEGNRRRMSFDYQLHPGLSTTTNALILLEMVGLDAEGEEGSLEESNRS